MTIYMPTILLNIIGHSTNYFKPFFFEAVVTVNLTVMLVLTTMFVGVSQSLPKTSYIKMVDIWLVFNLLIPFVEVLIHTYEVNICIHSGLWCDTSLHSSGYFTNRRKGGEPPW